MTTLFLLSVAFHPLIPSVSFSLRSRAIVRFASVVFGSAKMSSCSALRAMRLGISAYSMSYPVFHTSTSVVSGAHVVISLDWGSHAVTLKKTLSVLEN